MRFSRLESLIPKANLTKINNQTILIFGLGGVGSFAAEAIARSAFSKIILVDYDTVDITNINRQLIALEDTLSLYKVDVMKSRILKINPECHVTTYKEKVCFENIHLFFQEKIDFVIECIDDLPAKVLILAYAQNHGINIISAMGFANKFHPELIEISTLDKTTVCPLAKTFRSLCRNAGLNLLTPVVFSKESPTKPVSGTLLGSTAFVPSSAGLMMASYVFNNLRTKEEEQ